jgi:hypothetical protein
MFIKKVKYLILLAGLSAGPAFAGLAQGTPLFTCTAPTQQIDSFGVLSPLPATGTNSLKEFRLYIDGAGTALLIAPGQTSAACTFQTTVGQIVAGNHTAQVTAVAVSGAESAKSTSLPFVVPAPTIVGPSAPSGVTVQ